MVSHLRVPLGHHRHPHTDTTTHRCVHMDIQKTKSVREEKEKSQLAAVEEHHDLFHSDIQQTELWLQKTLLLSLNEGMNTRHPQAKKPPITSHDGTIPSETQRLYRGTPDLVKSVISHESVS